jgi:hypothetical protein
MSWRASDVLLIFDVLLDHCERCATNGADEIAARPKYWQACSQHLKFLLHTRCPTIDAPHQPMDAELRIPVEQQMHMIWHHFHFDQARLGSSHACWISSFRRTSIGGMRTGRRYFGQNTTWYLHENSTFRFDLNSATGHYIANPCIAIKRRLPPYIKLGACAPIFGQQLFQPHLIPRGAL